MRKLLYVTLMIAAFVSCGKSPEEKAQALIEDAVKKSLYIPESYDPVETKVDSAFAPDDDPAFYEKLAKVNKMYNEMQDCEERAKSAKSSMALWSSPYMSSYARNQYNENKAEYEEYTHKRNELEEKGRKLADEIRSIIKQEPTFIGFKAIHRYRAKNNAGQVLMGGALFLLDKDMKEILASYDMESEEYEALQQGLKELRENMDE